jgi:hypothetical protein
MKPIGEITTDMLAGLEARMKAQRGRHAWDEPVRPDLNNTFRTCRKCGIVKITRHEDDNVPRHWTEWERDGAKITAAGTPRCEDGIPADTAIGEEDAA